MREEELSLGNRILKFLDLLLPRQFLLQGRLVAAKRIADFYASIYQRLFKTQLGGFLLCLCNLKVCPKLSFHKQGLNQRSHCRSHKLRRINNCATGTIGPSGIASNSYLRIKSGASLIGGVESGSQLQFGDTDIGTIR